MISAIYKEQYERERARLIETLGKILDGGLVEAIQHISATSITGWSGSSCVDIALAVWPFPLEQGPRSRLEAIIKSWKATLELPSKDFAMNPGRSNCSSLSREAKLG